MSEARWIAKAACITLVVAAIPLANSQEQGVPRLARSAYAASTSSLPLHGLTCGAAAEARRPAHSSGGAPERPIRSAGVRSYLQPLPTDTGGTFAVQADTVVWASAADRDGVPRLYEADLRHFVPRVLAAGTRCGTFPSARISPGWIAWVQPDPHAFTVWALDRHSGRRRRLDTQPYNVVPCAGVACAPSPEVALDGNTVVWPHVSVESGPNLMHSSLMLAVLPVGLAHQVVDTEDRCVQHAAPQVAGNLLVWLRFSWTYRDLGGKGSRFLCDGPQTDVVSMRLQSGRVRVLSLHHGVGRPTTNGSQVAWEIGNCFLDCGDGSLVVLDLKSGTRTVVDGPTVKSQRMTGPVLVWHREGGNGITIKARDLQSGRTYVLAQQPFTEGLPSLQDPGWGFGRRVIWSQRTFRPRGETGYLGIADLPRPGPGT